jgi:hypothetical protein
MYSHLVTLACHQSTVKSRGSLPPALLHQGSALEQAYANGERTAPVTEPAQPNPNYKIPFVFV